MGFVNTFFKLDDPCKVVKACMEYPTNKDGCHRCTRYRESNAGLGGGPKGLCHIWRDQYYCDAWWLEVRNSWTAHVTPLSIALCLVHSAYIPYDISYRHNLHNLGFYEKMNFPLVSSFSHTFRIHSTNSKMSLGGKSLKGGEVKPEIRLYQRREGETGGNSKTRSNK